MTTNTISPIELPSRAGFLVAHPDDGETMLGAAIHGVSDAHVIVASNGELSTLDFRSNRLC